MVKDCTGYALSEVGRNKWIINGRIIIMKIELITNESGDWEMAKIDGTAMYSGHRLYMDDYASILKDIGLDVEYKIISDEEMEEIA